MKTKTIPNDRSKWPILFTDGGLDYHSGEWPWDENLKNQKFHPEIKPGHPRPPGVRQGVRTVDLDVITVKRKPAQSNCFY